MSHCGELMCQNDEGNNGTLFAINCDLIPIV